MAVGGVNMNPLRSKNMVHTTPRAGIWRRKETAREEERCWDGCGAVVLAGLRELVEVVWSTLHPHDYPFTSSGTHCRG